MKMDRALLLPPRLETGDGFLDTFRPPLLEDGFRRSLGRKHAMRDIGALAKPCTNGPCDMAGRGWRVF